MRVYTEHTPERICAKYKGRDNDYSFEEKQSHLLSLSKKCGTFKSWDFDVFKSSLGYTLRRMQDANARIQYEEQGQGTLGYSNVFDHVYMFKNKKGDLFLVAFPYAERSTIVDTLEEVRKNFNAPDLEFAFLGDEFNFISKYNEGFVVFMRNKNTERLRISQYVISD